MYYGKKTNLVRANLKKSSSKFSTRAYFLARKNRVTRITRYKKYFINAYLQLLHYNILLRPVISIFFERF